MFRAVTPLTRLTRRREKIFSPTWIQTKLLTNSPVTFKHFVQMVRSGLPSVLGSCVFLGPVGPCVRVRVFTSEGLHLLLDARVHAEVEHQLHVFLCILHGHHLHTHTHTLTQTHPFVINFLSSVVFVFTSSSPFGFRSTAEKPWTFDDGQNWKFNLQKEKSCFLLSDTCWWSSLYN